MCNNLEVNEPKLQPKDYLIKIFGALVGFQVMQ